MKKIVLVICLLWAVAAFVNADGAITEETWSVMDITEQVFAIAAVYDSMMTFSVVAKIRDCDELSELFESLADLLTEAAAIDLIIYVDMVLELDASLTLSDALFIYAGYIQAGNDPYDFFNDVEEEEVPEDVL